jgi:hypothetical protein
VQPALEAAGLTVTFGGLYYDWNGTTPDVNDFQVVVLLDGFDYGNDLTPGALEALHGSIAAGCGLVTTEWATYDVYQGYKPPDFGALLPVESPQGDYGSADVWTVLDTGHPLAAGLPASWSDDAGWSAVSALAGSSVVVEGALGNPLVTYGRLNGGVVVHLNHDLTYTTTTMSAEILAVFGNAARYAALCLPFHDGFETGSGSEWSSVVP